MTNFIPSLQNENLQLERLAAQRQLYTSAKNVMQIKFFLTIPILILLSIITFLVPTLKIWYAFYGIFLVLINAAILNPFEISLKKQAATIQELFDCEMFQLPWPKWKLNEKPDPELIQKEVTNYIKKNHDFSALQDWYPKQIEKLPHSFARLLCQRINLKYDADLRRHYTTRLLILFILVGIIIVSLGIFSGLTIETFILAMLAPLLPLIIWGMDEYSKNIHAADHLENLKRLSEQLWNLSISSSISREQFDRESRDLQNEIFDCRKNNPLIFDWIYNRMKDPQQDQMYKSADFFVSEAIKSLKEDEVLPHD